jgi:hypothetical protein
MVLSGIRSSMLPTIDRAAECVSDLGMINALRRRSLEDRSYLGMLLTRQRNMREAWKMMLEASR